MKKAYVKPIMKTEKISIGVFGSYGGSGGDLPWHRKRRRHWWNWFFN